MTTIGESIKITDNSAVVIPETNLTLTYRQLSSYIGNFQTLFNSNESPLFNSKKQLTIATALPNGLEFLVAFLGTTISGNVIAPLNSNYKQSEFEFYLDDLKADAIIVPQGIKLNSEVIKAVSKFPEILIVEIFESPERSTVDFAVYYHEKIKFTSKVKTAFQNSTKQYHNARATDNQVAMILHTSGTTSRPKQVPLTHLNLTTSFKNIANTYDLSPKDRSYVVMPLFHVHGLIGSLLSTLYSQGTVIIPEKFSAKKFWDDFVTHKANWYSAVPTIHQILLNVPKPSKIPDIRFIRSCSSALAPATFEKLEKHFEAPIVEAYAMTEAAHQMTSNNIPSKGQRKPGTVGQPQGVEVVVLDDAGKILPQGQIGEVSIKGLNVTKGYINNPTANKENFTAEGYFRTGDQGKFDKDGFLSLTGRLKELINRGGEKISPVELDGILLHHPSINEVVFFGASDEKYGQAVQVAIVLKDGAKLTEEDVKEYLKDKVAAFKIPTKVFIVDVLPKTATGKIQRRKIAEFFAPKAKL
ncbi:oxalate--CoA ligase [[Candida] railenensis]|uniref:Oxalate--CoA ligase n=1 Tax=[Candida] railenensis TaxID=45579 RepID=A0A9P0VYH1_9ASCO|nr:oxalate--CoA ligase [[Candida] railenensis]